MLSAFICNKQLSVFGQSYTFRLPVLVLQGKLYRLNEITIFAQFYQGFLRSGYQQQITGPFVDGNSGWVHLLVIQLFQYRAVIYTNSVVLDN